MSLECTIWDPRSPKSSGSTPLEEGVLLLTAKQGDNALGSVCPSVCPFVGMCACLSELRVNRLTYDFDFLVCRLILTLARFGL